MSNQYQNAKTKMSNFVICIFDLGFHLLFELFPPLRDPVFGRNLDFEIDCNFGFPLLRNGWVPAELKHLSKRRKIKQ